MPAVDGGAPCEPPYVEEEPCNSQKCDGETGFLKKQKTHNNALVQYQVHLKCSTSALFGNEFLFDLQTLFAKKKEKCWLIVLAHVLEPAQT